MSKYSWTYLYRKYANHRCFILRGLFMLSTLFCFSCGKKITNIANGATPQKTKLNNQEETLEFGLIPSDDEDILSAETTLKKRLFYALPEKIHFKNVDLYAANVYFHVREDFYEYLCHFEKKEFSDRFLRFKECLDKDGEKIEHLQVGVKSYLPSGENIFIEAYSQTPQKGLLYLEMLNN